MKFEADLPHCVRNVKEKNVLLFKFRCNIFIGVRIIKEMLGSVASGTPCSLLPKLNFNGVTVKDYEWTNSYLRNRYQRLEK